MAYKHLVLAFGMMLVGSPGFASQPDPMPQEGAPPAAPDARYCLRVEPVTGSRVETIRCETREDWALLDVDVDKEWAQEGVRVIGPMPLDG